MKLGPKAFPKLFPKQTNTHTLSNSATSLLNSRRRHHSGTRCNQCPKRQDRTGTASDGGNGVGRQETASDDKKQRRTAGSRKLVSQQQRRRRITTRSRRNSPKHVQKSRRHEDVCSLQRPGKKCRLNGPKCRNHVRQPIRGLILA